MDKSVEAASKPEIPSNLDRSDSVIETSSDEYVQFQRRIFLAALIVSAFAVMITAIVFDTQVTISFLIGAVSGILYLRLLSRSVGRLGKSSKTVGKIQLLVPILLVVAVSRLPQLALLPSLLGFLLYKPSLIIQVLLDS